MADASGYQAISFYNPSDGTVVQIEEENLERVDFTQGDMETDKTTARGNKPFVGHVSELEVETWDWTGLSQLKTWAENDTPISFVAAGYQRSIQWYEKDRISLSLSPKSETGAANTYVISMRREGGGAHDIHNNINIFAFKGWEDSDSNNIADGYEIGVGTADSTSFSGGAQSVTASADLNFRTINDTVEFPISGITVTLSAEATSLHGSATEKLIFQQDDSSSTLISQSETTLSSTGRHSVEADLDSNAFHIQGIPHQLGSVGASGTFTVKDPCLRLDGSTEYVDH